MILLVEVNNYFPKEHKFVGIFGNEIDCGTSMHLGYTFKMYILPNLRREISQNVKLRTPKRRSLKFRS